MNKTKMTLAVSGGVIGLAVLATAYFTWSAFSAKTAAIEGDDGEGVDGLETVTSKAQTLSRKAVYPCAESLAAIESNQTLVVEWQKEAAKLAARGDKVFEKTTPAAFKTFIVADAKRLATLPGAAGGVLVKPEFAFGPFKDYIAEGKMPADAQLALMQRKWDDVATVVEILAKCGIAELLDVQFFDKTANKQGGQNGEQKQKAKKDNDRKAGSGAHDPVSYSYTFTFATKPVGFVKSVNALATCEQRFISIDDFTFTRTKDAIAEALGGDEKKSDGAKNAGRGRRRRGASSSVTEEKKDKDEEKKSSIITDPLIDAPFTVVMNVTVHDFHSLDGQKTEEEKK